MDRKTMDRKTTGIVAYFSWVGWAIAYLAGDREEAKFHLNQALVLNIAGLLALVPYVGYLISIFVLAMRVMALVGAANGEEKKLPVVGNITLLK